MANPIINTKQGDLKGITLKTSSGKEFYAFRGIPYAKPPVGDLRFKAPVPSEPWSGIRDATKEGNICLQLDMKSGQLIGDEDCLFLNIYTPKLSSTESKQLPVMVFIHGGGFVYGSGNATELGPDFLIEKDVILITFNYRLSVFGFVSFQTPDAPGNAGMKDQILVLKWIQENIKQFNGDPTNVTIFGESAGGASVEYQVLSPLSKGLFQKAIAQSGSSLNHWTVSDDIIEKSFQLALLTGLDTKQPSEAVKHLQNLPASDLLQGSLKISKDIHSNGGMDFLFVPSIETTSNSFIFEDTLELLKSGCFNRVHFMSGFTRREGLVNELLDSSLTETLVANKDLIKSFPTHYRRLSKLEGIEDEINKIYTSKADKEGEKDAFAIDYLSDINFIGGIYVASRLISKYTNPVYLYEFAYDGDCNYVKRAANINKPGACHGDELGYLFKTSFLPEKVPQADLIVRQRLVELWTNFAKYGNPTPTTNQILPFEWKPVTSAEVNYLVIDDKLSLKKDPIPERMSFYEKLYLDSV